MNNNITSTSPPEIQQDIFDDPTMGRIEVSHVINLTKGRDVILRRMDKYARDDEGRRYELDELKGRKSKGIKIKEYVTEFFYQVIDSKVPGYHARKFPERGNYYPTNGYPHHVIAHLLENTK